MKERSAVLVNPLQDSSLPLFPKLIQFLLNDAPPQAKKENIVQCFLKKNSDKQQKHDTFQLHGKLSF